MAPSETFRLPAQVRRRALQALSRERLSQVTEYYGLSVDDRRVHEQHIGAIVRSRSIDFVEILEVLSRDELKAICVALGLDESGREKDVLIERILSLREKETPSEPSSSPAGLEAPSPIQEPPLPKAEPLSGPVTAEKEAKKVFIIHGRERAVLQELKHFLKAVGLQSWTFDDEVHEAPHVATIPEVVTRGVSKTKAVIALLTADEFSTLVPDLRTPTDSERDIRRWQPRPNVIYEAGIAMALNRAGTILVTVGRVDLPSDLDGVFLIRMSNAVEARRALRRKLISIGCAVDTGMDDWMGHEQGGDFDVAQIRKMPADPFSSE
jgi:predicted nucleotide-binding protein